MRRAKFVKLISIYLDGEITPGEQKLLFDEVRHDPKQKELFESFTKINSAASLARFSSCPCTMGSFMPVSTMFAWCFSGSLVGIASALIFLSIQKPAAQEVVTDKVSLNSAIVVSAKQAAPPVNRYTTPRLFDELVSLRKDTVTPFIISLRQQSAFAFMHERETAYANEDDSDSWFIKKNSAKAISFQPFRDQMKGSGISFANLSTHSSDQ